MQRRKRLGNGNPTQRRGNFRRGQTIRKTYQNQPNQNRERFHESTEDRSEQSENSDDNQELEMVRCLVYSKAFKNSNFHR